MNRSIILKTVMALSVVLSLALTCYGKGKITSAVGGGRVLTKSAAGPVGRASGRLDSFKTPATTVDAAGPVGQL